MQLSDEKEKRRRGELERKELVRHVQLKDKELEEMQLQLKRVLKENDILGRQVEFL